ncbi:hypothetical protein Tco_1284752 [Tanacetum coccineum]
MAVNISLAVLLHQQVSKVLHHIPVKIKKNSLLFQLVKVKYVLCCHVGIVSAYHVQATGGMFSTAATDCQMSTLVGGIWTSKMHFLRIHHSIFLRCHGIVEGKLRTPLRISPSFKASVDDLLNSCHDRRSIYSKSQRRTIVKSQPRMFGQKAMLRFGQKAVWLRFGQKAMLRFGQKAMLRFGQKAVVEIWSKGNVEIWSKGNVEIWSKGNVEIWSKGNVEIWSKGNG